MATISALTHHNNNFPKKTVFGERSYLITFQVIIEMYESAYNGGSAIAQAASRRLPTMSTRVRAHVMWYLWWTKWH
jgi:hypothetical protein